MAILDANEVEVLAIQEALHIFVSHFHASLIVESDSANVVLSISSPLVSPWRFQFYIDEDKSMSCKFKVILSMLGSQLMLLRTP